MYTKCQSVSNDPISLRWVITEKKIDGKCHVKARLVARGFESFDQRCDSPTCSKENIRLVFAIISSNGWSLRSLDIKEAFLQGDMIDRNVFVVPPKEAETDAIWRLKKNCIWAERRCQIMVFHFEEISRGERSTRVSHRSWIVVLR